MVTVPLVNTYSTCKISATLPVSHENDEEAVLREDDNDDASDDIDANDWGCPGLMGVRKVKLLCFSFNISIYTS
jgi:hypothetical protein